VAVATGGMGAGSTATEGLAWFGRNVVCGSAHADRVSCQLLCCGVWDSVEGIHA
jgi:hypothetical protein